MQINRAVAIGAFALSVALVAGACGGSGGSAKKNDSSAAASTTTSTAKKPSLTVASFNFAESTIVAQMYAKALKAKGYDVTVRAGLGSREVVEPALEKGEIDVYPGYAATELEFVNKAAGEASSDPTATVAKLNERLKPKSIQALTASPAIDANAFVVSKATAEKYHIAKLSDLAAIGDKLTLGGPPECPTRPFCQKGLEDKYGIKFKSFRPLDAGGPLSKGAVEKGDVDVALVFSSDGAIAAKGFVVLEDDKHLQNADNIVAVIRSDKATPEVTSILDAVDAKLTTDDLSKLNKSADIDHEDPEVLAQGWVKDHQLG